MKVRTRIAPSPTGAAHQGLARTALFNYALAKSSGGEFILRIEDTDKKRSTKESVLGIIEDLNWLGLTWDEGPSFKDPFDEKSKIYYQSERNAIYDKFLERLQRAGRVYEKDGAIWFSVEDKDVSFYDEVIGFVKFKKETLEDFVIIKSDGSPTYHFAVVCDDADMNITHVVRGQEHLNNTPKHIQLYRALTIIPPIYAHIPLIMNEDGSKVSKRQDNAGLINIKDFREAGYLPDTMLQYLCSMSWSKFSDPKKINFEVLKTLFSLENVKKTNVIVDLNKLNFINRHNIRNLTQENLVKEIRTRGCEIEPSKIRLMEKRLKKKSNFRDMILEIQDLHSDVTEYSSKLHKALFDDDQFSYDILMDVYKGLKNTVWKDEEILELLNKIKDKHKIRLRHICDLIRYVLLNKLTSPPIQETLVFIGKKNSIDRLGRFLKV